ncbi:nicotinate-nucleotide adenylyltransferase [Prochlorococcus sp. MIT 1223]|uniref:nicotinate-nucleotide adenylyltransferase n=1 Tax=Prochlorococcus sp. MIT 1223 TaxID=3096217 RepID=UPI002A74E093|nr:nicotinate-nucleotide adenylyltransferase [Prochlorococcus sp. MIT 1223]
MNTQHDSIALFGTSADPPTCGHEALLKGLLNIFPKVVTWASDNPLKNHSIPLQKRYELLKLLVEDIQNPHLEINQKLSSPWTIKTLEKANELWPSSNMIFIIGSDLMEQLPSWLRVKDVLNKARIGVAKREGWPIQENQLQTIKGLGGVIDLLPLDIPDSSSSTFRKRFKLAQIPKVILPLLMNQNLYDIKNK